MGIGNSQELPPAYVESEFWRLRRSQDATGIYILYGNDVEGSACDRNDPGNIGSTAWNLQVMATAALQFPGFTVRRTWVEHHGHC